MDLKVLPSDPAFKFGVTARKQDVSNGLYGKTGIVEGREKASLTFDKATQSGIIVGDNDCTLRNCVRVGRLVIESLKQAKKQPLDLVSFFLSLILFIALILFFLFTS